MVEVNTKNEKTAPHNWTRKQKAKLLEGIADCITKGVSHRDNINIPDIIQVATKIINH